MTFRSTRVCFDYGCSAPYKRVMSVYEPSASSGRHLPGLTKSSMKRLGVVLPALDGIMMHRRVNPPNPPPSIKFTSTHLYTWLERSNVRMKCLAQEHNTMSGPDRLCSSIRRGEHKPVPLHSGLQFDIVSFCEPGIGIGFCSIACRGSANIFSHPLCLDRILDIFVIVLATNLDVI